MAELKDNELKEVDGGTDKPSLKLMVTCPNCGHEFNAFEYLGSGLISMDDNTISTSGYTCPSCGNLFTK